MVARWWFALVGLLAGCTHHPEARPTEPPATPAPSACVEACERSQQMRAVAAEVITRDCERRCAADAG